jgi:hypothetical protein
MRPWRLACEVVLLGVALGAIPVFGQQRGPVLELADGTVIDDPAAAFAHEVAAILGGEPRVQPLRGLTEEWAAHDPEAAAQAVESLPKHNDGALLREALGEIAGRRWAERDAAAAIDWARKLGELGVWSGVVVGLAATDPHRAMAVASGVQTRPGEEMANVVIAAVAARDPAAAAELWQNAGLPELSSYTSNRIARSWVARDAAAAARWALRLPAGDGRDTALVTILGFAALDAVRAAELVNEIHAPEARGDGAANWLLNAIARGEPNMADFESRLILSPAARAELNERLPR